ncbi:cysteine desulfurase family protein [Kordiimonas sp. SCSIO 12610]|uniref:cysteine desulfurase family protein n=1 Tax=Kordiimonas sp. SCSIO 12610 TaxID=2829597 RepID=UPI0021097DFE|nr:aminotransferase class V-fold PLP-dependent enzyme [Kordiimonas sp. SCSIO 12610]UTW53859.1 aminotransferase class V-fold PLP-dependent enzyme [Kordiimonas sp. SCSIO 12610]
MKTPVYLDNQATTPLDPRVLEVMMPYFTEKFGNPHSATHKYGWEGEAALDIAREQVASVIAANADEIIFTSGATEANNMAIKGVMQVWAQKKPEIITLNTEHKCVLASARACERYGAKVTVIPVEANGLLDVKKLEAAISDKTALVSVMAVNNEIGVIQPLKEIGEIVKAAGAIFHTDAAQAFGKIPIDVRDMNVDLLSISGHKIYGPKGVGALYKRNHHSVALSRFMDGGAQEREQRAGTQAPALVAGLGKAAAIASNEMLQENGRLYAMMQRFKTQIKSGLNNIIVNGDEDQRIPGNLNISFPDVDNDRLLSNIRDLALSSGSACASGTSDPSHVLEAIKGPDMHDKNEASIRLGIGRFTSDEEIDFAANRIIRAVNSLRA